jgi:endonuclease/exonuclease/phosphatase family metal-dependent hydrolase
MELTIITYNIRHGKGMDGIVNIGRIGSLLNTYKADIIGLNEVDCHFSKRSNYINQPNSLSEHLYMNYVFGATISKPPPLIKQRSNLPLLDKEYGNVILSPHPIIQSQNHIIPSREFPFSENRSLLEATITIRNKISIKVYVGHFSLQKKIRKKQIQMARGKIQHDIEAGYPIVFMGDFNMSPKNTLWAELHPLLQDCWKVSEKHITNGATFPSVYPITRLDYILTSREFRVLSADVIYSNPKASDHLPLRVTMAIDP